MKLTLRILLALVAATLVVACHHTPGYVLGKEKMAQLMADIYVAESVSESQRQFFSNDSDKMLLKQSVLARHGVTQEQMDTSLVWYGHNMNDYLSMYDRVIEILERRQIAAGNLLIAANISIAGDSVDVWSGARHINFTNRMPSRLLTFAINADENTEPGDQYTWRVKLLNVSDPAVRWNIVAQYADSISEYLESTTNRRGWNEITFQSDSTKRLVSIRGYMSPGNEPSIWVDSIGLVRKRVNSETYSQRYRQRKIKDAL